MLNIVASTATELNPDFVQSKRISKESNTTWLERNLKKLAGEPGALSDSPLKRRAEELRVADLVAYREYIASLREWPIDARALRRFGLYLLIPLVSWIGSALMERGLDRVLD